MSKEATIAQAKKLRQEDQLEESQELLLELLYDHPDDPLVLYEVGGSYDVLGEEPEAIPYYQQAIAAGLAGDDLQECLVCLGSSQRYVGEPEKAIAILQEAQEKFPANRSAAVFLALAYYSDGQEDKAVKLLMELLLETTNDDNILAYRHALEYYKDHLDEEWSDEDEA
ncbi:MAG: tetratricopeptide repeat protein [Anaerolineales bacterium]|nr:tetratricopeptide repeat protein [Anaerolineales bacterium]